MRFLRYLSWLLRAFLFVVLLVFAVKNTAPVRLEFFFEHGWEVPLVLLLLVFFTLGAVLGVLACLSRLFGQRREIVELKRGLRDPRASDKPLTPPEPGA